MFTNKPLTTPVLFSIFNRPDTTRKVFNAIKAAKPEKLFVSADGPRRDVAGEDEKCKQTRAIIKQVDWKCEVYTNFREKNLGLKLTMSSGIDWFFKNVEEGIILEDDCLPTRTFFWFCQELLEKYRDDEKIMAINGGNSQFGVKRGRASYYFSNIVGVWGWASWRRAWRHFDLSLRSFPEFKKQNQIKNIFEDETSRIFWMTKIQETYDGGNSWAFPWAYSIFTQNGLCVTPNVNLVSNIGFGPDGVHATNPGSLFANIRTAGMKKIIHPTFILPNRNADESSTKLAAQEQLFNRGLVGRMKLVLKALVKKTLPVTHLNMLRRVRQWGGRCYGKQKT